MKKSIILVLYFSLALVFLAIFICVYYAIMVIRGETIVYRNPVLVNLMIRSSIIKDFPILPHSENVKYREFDGDGFGRGYGLSYISKENPAIIQMQIEKYLNKRGYYLSKYGYPDYTNGNQFVAVEINQRRGGHIEIIVRQFLE